MFLLIYLHVILQTFQKLFLITSVQVGTIIATSADADQKTEINNEIETLADDLNNLLKTIETLNEGDFADEKISSMK